MPATRQVRCLVDHSKNNILKRFDFIAKIVEELKKYFHEKFNLNTLYFLFDQLCVNGAKHH